jgi:hypothetical protein
LSNAPQKVTIPAKKNPVPLKPKPKIEKIPHIRLLNDTEENKNKKVVAVIITF